MIYEWFGYSTPLGQHLRGWDITCSGYLGPDLYFQTFITMLGINIFLFILMYLVVDRITAKYSSKSSWWITALIGAAANFGIAYSLPGTIPNCVELVFGGSDLLMFGIANAVWSLIVFALFTSFSFPRNFSTNCRLTTFWKP